MAGSAGRRNILQELRDPHAPAVGPSVPHSNFNFPPTPTSPDEEVIRLRGRRKAVQVNPDESPVKIRRSPLKKTPVKKPATPPKAFTTPLRSSPRKRLNLSPDPDDADDFCISELTITSRRPKRARYQNLTEFSKVGLGKGLLALSHDQLVHLVNTVANASVDFRMAVEASLPAPDLLPLEKKLFDLKRNIFKAYPRNVFGVEDGSFCYTRVRTHIDAFKKECLDQCDRLVDSQHWPTVIEYILTALGYAKALPNWALASHNKSKDTCIKKLVSHFTSSFRAANFESSTHEEIIERLKDLDMEEYTVDFFKELEEGC